MADGHFAVNIEVSFSEELSDTCSSDATEVNICFCIPSNMYLLAMHKHTCTLHSHIHCINECGFGVHVTIWKTQNSPPTYEFDTIQQHAYKEVIR